MVVDLGPTSSLEGGQVFNHLFKTLVLYDSDDSVVSIMHADNFLTTNCKPDNVRVRAEL